MFNKIIFISAILLSSSSFAAKLVNHDEAMEMNLEKIESVSLSQTNGEVGSPTDAQNALSAKADAMGGRYYEIVSGREVGSSFVAIAIVYK